MTREIVFRRAAKSEFDDAVAWYENERPGLGLEFQAAVDLLLINMVKNPLMFPEVRGPVRRAVIKRFPYTIHFLPETNRLVVLAIYHAARNPKELSQRTFS